MICLWSIAVALSTLTAIRAEPPFPRTFVENKIEYEIVPIVPEVSGLRVEDLPPPHPPAFMGTNDGMTVVEPDTKCMVVIFGERLDMVEFITFTESNCNMNSPHKVLASEFLSHSDRRIELYMSFPDIDEEWRLCVKQRGEHGEFALVYGSRTLITTTATEHHHFLPFSVQVMIIVGLFSLSALFSGLNLGLMSLSINELQLIINSGSKREKRYAEAILPIRIKGNYLLCTILIMNVVVNSSISILFEDLTSGTVAFILASMGIVVFGEIVPQSFCVKKGLAVGAYTVPLTRLFMKATFPLSYPISRILDVLLGEQVERYDRRRLLEILKIEVKNETKEYAQDLRIAVGAMEIANKRVLDVMTRIDDALMISDGDVLNQTTVARLLKKGYSRIPVFEGNDRNNVTSVLFIKDLALVHLKHSVTVKAVVEMNQHPLRVVLDTMGLPELLEEFKMARNNVGEYHLAVVEKTAIIEESEEEEDQGWLAERLSEYKEHDCSVAVVEHFPAVDNLLPDVIQEEEEIVYTPRTAEATPLRGSIEKSIATSGRKSPGGTGEIVGLITLEDILEEILQSEIIDESDTVMDNAHRLKRRMPNRLQELLSSEAKTDPLSLHQLTVVEQWLKSHFPIFTDHHMEPVVLRRMIQANIREIYVMSKSGTIKHGMVLQEGIPSKRAVLILQGSLEARFAQSGMKFIVGPWTFYGESSVLRAQRELLISPRVTNLSFVPDFALEAKETCRFLQLPFPQIVHAYKVTQFIRNIPRASQLTKSEEFKATIGDPSSRRQKSTEMPIRKLSDYVNRSTVVRSKKDMRICSLGFSILNHVQFAMSSIMMSDLFKADLRKGMRVENVSFVMSYPEGSQIFIDANEATVRLVDSVHLASSPKNATARNIAQPPAPTLEYPEFSSSIDRTQNPCDNFYNFACNGWRKKNALRPGDMTISHISLIERKIAKEMADMVRNGNVLRKTEHGMKADFFYKKCMGIDERNRLGSRPLLERIRSARGRVDKSITGWLIEMKPLDLFHQIFVSINDYNSSLHMLEVAPSSPLLTMEHYASEESRAIYALRNFLQTLLDILSEDDWRSEFISPFDFERSMRIEKFLMVDREMANIIHETEPVDLVVTFDELETFLPSIEWYRWLRSFELDPRRYSPESYKQMPVRLRNAQVLRRFDEMLSKMDLGLLANFMEFRLMCVGSSYLDERFKVASDRYSEESLGVTLREKAMAEQCIKKVQDSFAEIIGAIYVQHHFDSATDQEASAMLRNIKDSLISMMKESKWMDEATKANAIKKVHAIRDTIGFDRQMNNKTNQDIIYGDLNITANMTYFDMANAEVGQPHPMTTKGNWRAMSMVPTEVNAFYDSTTNQMTLLAGMLQRPLFDPTLPRLLNYAAMGSITGHELTHAFDIEGFPRDASGSRSNWFDTASFDKYTSLTRCFVDQYGSRVITETGDMVDGERTASENIADNGGVKASHRAATKLLQSPGEQFRVQGLEDLSPEQLFYSYYAYANCANYDPRAVHEELQYDVHALNEHRVNVVFSNDAAFQAAFNCPARSAMVAEPRCELW